MAFNDILDYKKEELPVAEEEVLAEEEVQECCGGEEEDCCNVNESECDCDDEECECGGECGSCGHSFEYAGVYRISVPGRSVIVVVNQMEPDRQYYILTPSLELRRANIELIDSLLADRDCLVEYLFNAWDNIDRIVKKIKETFKWEI